MSVVVAVTVASIPVLLLVLLIGGVLVAAARPFARIVADGNAAHESRTHGLIQRATHLAMAGIGVLWIALALVGLTVHVVQ